MFFMMLFPLILFVVLVYVNFGSSGRGNSIDFRGGTNGAIDILKRRFASGEISEEEFLKRSSLLKEK